MSDVRPMHGWRVFLLFLAGLAICVQAIIPAGFMPGMGKQAGQAITICSGFEQKIVYLPDDEGMQHEAAEFCAFAFLLTNDRLIEPQGPVLSVAYIALILQSLQTFPSALAGFDAAYPPTGPPTHLA